jgi:hypothetical protein
MPAEAFRSCVAHAAAAPAVPPGAVAEPEAGADDADAAPVGLAAGEDVAEAEDAGAAGAELLDDKELQPAASVTARNATPPNSPR